MARRTLLAEIVIGVLVAVIAAVIVARLGIDRPDKSVSATAEDPKRSSNLDDVKKSSNPVDLKKSASLNDLESSSSLENVESSSNLIGSWQGSFLINNVPVNDIYTFYPNGTMADAVFDHSGQQIGGGYGRYSYAGGRLDISFSGGVSEKGSVTWIDENRFHYRIIDHTESAQIGLEIHYSRMLR